MEYLLKNYNCIYGIIEIGGKQTVSKDYCSNLLGKVNKKERNQIPEKRKVP